MLRHIDRDVECPGHRARVTGDVGLEAADAVQPFGQLERVYLVRDGVARLQLVKTGIAGDDRVEILAGVVDGDQVVIAAPRELGDGRKVIVR